MFNSTFSVLLEAQYVYKVRCGYESLHLGANVDHTSVNIHIPLKERRKSTIYCTYLKISKKKNIVPGIIPHSNHPAAAVMIVNPTTPITTGTISQPFNVSNTMFELSHLLSKNPKKYIYF